MPSDERTPAKRISYANVVATVALFVALGGGAYAAATAAKDSVTSKSVKNESLKGKDVKNESLTGDDVKEDSLALSLGSADVVDDSLTGADVNESTLQLPDAPDEVAAIFRRQPPNTETFETIFERDGLKLEGQCTGNLGGLNLRFDHEAGLLSVENQFDAPAGTPATLRVSSGAANDNAPIGTGNNGSAHVQVSWRRESDGKTLGLDFTATNTNTAVGLECAYFGTAFSPG